MEINLFKALADETRLRIVFILSEGEFTVMELMDILKMGQSRVSRHLGILTNAAVTSFRRDGTWVYYRLEPGGDHEKRMIACVVRWLNDEEELHGYRDSIANVLEARRKRVRHYFSGGNDKGEHHLRPYIDDAGFHNLLQSFAEGTHVIAELGCGSGENLVELASHQKKIIGVDNSRVMLNRAASRLRGIVGSELDLRLGNLEHLPLTDQEVDGVLVSMVLHHLAMPVGVFHEFSRILKPGGKLLIVDFIKHEDEQLRNDMADLWLGFTEEEIMSWLEKSGFTDVTFESMTNRNNDKTVFTAISRKRTTPTDKERKNVGKF